MSETLPGSVLTEADFETLQKSSWISPELAAQAMLRRVTSAEGAKLVGRNGSGTYAGIVFPHVYPGFEPPSRYGLRRDKSDLVVNAKGEPEESGLYLAGPGRNNSFYFVPGTAIEVLDDPEIPVILTVSEESTLALHRLSRHGLAADAKPRFLPLGLAGPWNWRGYIGEAPGPDKEWRHVKDLIPDFKRIKWNGRKVLIVFGREVATDSSVQAARRQLAEHLTQRCKCEVLVIDLPPEPGVQRIDELLALWGADRVLALVSHGTPADPLALARLAIDGLAERIKDDPGAAFTPEVVHALAVTRVEDPAEWARLGKDLQKAGISMRDLQTQMKLERRRKVEPLSGEALTATSTLGDCPAPDRQITALDIPTAQDQNKADESVGLPKIIVTDRQLRDVSAEAYRALVRANSPPVIFTRAGVLASVIKDETDRPVIRTLQEDSLRGHMTRTANYFNVVGEDEESVGTSPPIDIVKDLLSVGGWPDFPPLYGITQVPIVRPDGTIFDQPGYDPKTRLVYAPEPGFTLSSIPEHPTQADLEAAKGKIWEAIGEFPFVDDASFANTFGLLVTLLVRHTVPKAPLALLDAPDAGSGKGLLSDVITMIATGRVGALMGALREDDEWRKQITALLMAGTSVIVIDNVVRPLASAHLCRALTAFDWQDRILGVTKEVILPQRATWIATGNNIRLEGDMPRRCFWIRLNAKVRRPWKRKDFRHADLVGWVTAKRAELLAAALTLIRGWYAAGCPVADVPAFGSFEDWTSTVGGILAFAGIKGFLGNLEGLYETADAESPQWEALLAECHQTFGDRPFTTAEFVAEYLYDSSPFLELLPDELADSYHSGRGSFQHKLGRALAARIERRYGDAGYYLQRAPDDTHSKVARWQVLRSA